MSRHAATRGSAATTTTVLLAALLIGFAAGIPAAMYGITRDWDTTAHAVVLAAAVTGIAVCLLWMTSTVRLLYRSYRRQP